MIQKENSYPPKDVGVTTKHTFWNTQPVSQPGVLSTQSHEGPIQLKNPLSENLSKASINLPSGFQWVELHIYNSQESSDQQDLIDLYDLLRENYVEDYSSLFRFNYQQDFLRWALLSPGYEKSMHVGIRGVSTANSDDNPRNDGIEKRPKLWAFISAMPVKVATAESTVICAEVNFLCVHKRLRSKRLAPVLIKEITRRANLLGINQGVYTAGITLHQPFTTASYYHRPISPERLIRSGFCGEFSEEDVAKFVRKYALRDPLIKGEHPFLIHQAREEDLLEMFELFNEYIKKFSIKPLFSFDEFAHWLLPKKNCIYSYVFRSSNQQGERELLGFYSFYKIPSSILDENAKIKDTLNVAYSFYYGFIPAIYQQSQLLFQAMNMILWEAQKEGFDVFNALDVFDNQLILDNCKFGIGDGKLRYYLFNWLVKPVAPSEVAFLLL